DQRDHQRAQRGPSGPWPPLATSTRRGRSGRSGMLGGLPGAIRTRATADSLTISSLVPWAAAHQEGAVVARGHILPARPFLYFSDGFVDDIEEDLGIYIAQAYGR
ncbi:MAG: phage virion morphogenesis protein, partial [Mycobacterium sp.]